MERNTKNRPHAPLKGITEHEGAGHHAGHHAEQHVKYQGELPSHACCGSPCQEEYSRDRENQE